MKSKKIGLINVDGNYELVNTGLFPYDKDSDEECKENLISDDLLRDLKALEIIKEHPFEVGSVIAQPTYKDYCSWFASLKDGKPILSKEEYNLLREVFCEKCIWERY